jgi:ZIP family zinc transporter
MLFAIVIHNIPEGLAVGLVIASAINGSINEQAALILSIGIAIQNFPEGAVVSMPLKETGISKLKAFLYGVFSGIVEPIAAFIALLLTRQITVLLPYALSFAAGAMIYVVSDELIPEANDGKKSSLPAIGVSIGFIIMMILDIALS